MNRKILITVCLCLYAVITFSQNGVDEALKEIEKNNKTLLVERQYWDAEKLSYKTGLAPENPTAELDYMVGSPEGAGNQRDIAITQGFDFPTSYGKRKRVSEEQVINADHKFNATRQQVLLDGKLLCIEFIFRSKMEVHLQKRLANADRLLEATIKKTSGGEASILDLNKIRLLRLEINNEVELNLSDLKTLQHKLDELNGGVPLNTANIAFGPAEDLPSFQVIDSLIEANDPVVKVIQQEKEIAQKQLSLSKALSLPKLEGGYHQQAILGQKYEGFHVGMTIPLWENKNQVKTQRARVLHSDLAIEEHRNGHLFENKQLYEKYLHWRDTFAEYQQVLGSANNEELLNKAFEHGQINLIEYLMESRYFYDAINRSVEAEKELQSSIARLLKFQL